MIRQLRQDIDQIDYELISLFLDRIEKVEAIGRYKKENQMEVLDSSREAMIKERIEARLGESPYQEDVLNLMESIMSICRTIQNRSNTDLRPLVAYQGTEGSYSEEATINYFQEGSARQSYSTFEEVFEAVAAGDMTYGVVPIENSSTGGIREVYDLLLKYDLSIVGEYQLKVRHHLIGVPGSTPEDIREVYSHPQGIAQCSKYLSYHPDWKKVSHLNTASSVKLVSKQQDKQLAAIGSSRAAEIYGLAILKEGIQDNAMNTTRFIVLKRHDEENPKADKVSLVFSTAHTPGALHGALEVFAKKNINMLRLESRPIKHQPGDFTFYVDIEGDPNSEVVQSALTEISSKLKFFKILGKYQRHR